MSALLVVHDYDPATGLPTVPAGWVVSFCGTPTAPWVDITHPSGRRVLAWRENEDGVSYALWAVVGDTADLADLAAIVSGDMPARTAWRRKNDAAVKPHLMWWRTLRCSGARSDGAGGWVAFADEIVEAVPRGAQLPDWGATPFPWYLDRAGSIVPEASAVLRIDSVSGVDTIALLHSIGHGEWRAFADEPDPGAA